MQPQTNNTQTSQFPTTNPNADSSYLSKEQKPDSKEFFWKEVCIQNVWKSIDLLLHALVLQAATSFGVEGLKIGIFLFAKRRAIFFLRTIKNIFAQPVCI